MINTDWEKCKHGYDPILRNGFVNNDGCLDSPWRILGDLQHRVTRRLEWSVGELVELIGLLTERGYGRWFDDDYQFNSRCGLILRYTDEDFSQYDEDVRTILSHWQQAGLNHGKKKMRVV